MAWVVEASALESPPRHRNLVLLRAEWRRSWWLQVAVLGAGLGVWTLLHVVTQRVPTDALPEGVVFNYVGSLLLSVFPVLLSGPAVTRVRPSVPAGFWCSLPISRRTVNLLRMVGLTVHLWPTVLTWPLIIGVLSRVYGSVPPWLIVNTAVLAVLATLLTSRTALIPFICYLILPVQIALVHFVPAARPLAVSLATAWASPWLGAGLALAAACTVALLLRSAPSRRS